MQQLLLVEDDNQIGKIICDYFHTKGKEMYHVTWSTNGDSAFDLLYENTYDLVMLDIMLPGMDGLSICRNIRTHNDVPIIFLTAKGSEEDVLYGYSLGCDDYIVKPFRISELFAKVGALLNRAHKTIIHSELICGDIKLNPSTCQVLVKETTINLAPKEYTLLKYLLKNQGVVISREQLLLRLWGYDFDGNDRVVDNHIKKLRKALGDAGKLIQTKPKRGYMIEEK